MRVLIVGNGGREHCLLWKLRRDAPDASFFATRPNGGMAPLCASADVSPTDVDGVAEWARAHRVELVVIGPEAPLAAGLADRLEAVGVPAFGPSAAAARIESSKAFAKDLMSRAGVPTAEYRVHDNVDEAVAHVRARRAPLVVKASGLAGGKGAVVCASAAEAEDAVRRIFAGAFGAAGRRVVVEELMEGEELSVFCLACGEEFATLLPSQDHKRIGEGDTGPNTGGMGAYAPVSFATDELLAEVERAIVAPVLHALAAAGSPFRGLLYAGLMITTDGPKVVEFNCRFGDPETQAVLPLLDASLLEPMQAVARGTGLGRWRPAFRDATAVATVLAAPGYPGSYPTGAAVEIPPTPDNVHVFHAGTVQGAEPGTWATTGGRVLALTAVDPDFDAARAAGRAAAESVQFEGKQFRRDIGWREARRRAGPAGRPAPAPVRLREHPPLQEGATRS